MPIPGDCRTGVYCLRNLRNGKVYIGGAYKTFSKRFKSHRYALRNGIHTNEHLQAAWNKYGAATFRFSILETCTTDVLPARETYWIARAHAYDRLYGYNKSPTGGSPLGYKHTEETKDKVSAALKGKRKSAAHRASMSKAKMNQSQSTRDKLSAYARARTPEHRSNLSASLKGKPTAKGRVKPEAERKVLSEKAKLRWAEWKRTGRDKEIGARIRAGQKLSKESKKAD